MNRGNIPGYYYDDEKKKYFKIQANHIAPTNAKYSKTNVNQEQRQKREIKRRKVQENRVLRETVKRAQILRHPLLTGCGLQRELGNRPQSLNRASRDAVFVQGLETSYLELNVTGFVHTGVTDAQRLPYDRSLLAVTLYRGSHAVCLYDFFHDPVVSKVLPAQQPIVAFPEKIVSMESAMISSSRYLLASGNQFSSGYYYFGSLDVERSTNMFPITELRSIRTLWASKMNPSMPIAAFTGTGAVVVTSVEAPRPSIGVQRLDNDTESFALDWLSPYVLTYGITHEETNLQFRHCAYLWDVRIKNGNNVAANAARIKRAQRITGIKRPDESGHNLIITSSKDISLYDLRMTSPDHPPLLSIPHTSGSSRLTFDLRDHILAAADEYSNVAVYSLRTGERFSVLTGPLRGQGAIESLRWQDSCTGVPYLQACFGDNKLKRWAWGTWL